jgi:hypothetical protein
MTLRVKNEPIIIGRRITMKDKYYLETTKRYNSLKQQRQDLDKSGIYCVKLQG